MKRVVFILIALFAIANANIKEAPVLFNIEMPKITNNCNTLSFFIYKNRMCGHTNISYLYPRCIELNVKRVLGFDTSEAKFYSGDEARQYYKEYIKEYCKDFNKDIR
jgi:hypothetical protein